MFVRFSRLQKAVNCRFQDDARCQVQPDKRSPRRVAAPDLPMEARPASATGLPAGPPGTPDRARWLARQAGRGARHADGFTFIKALRPGPRV